MEEKSRLSRSATAKFVPAVCIIQRLENFVKSNWAKYCRGVKLPLRAKGNKSELRSVKRVFENLESIMINGEGKSDSAEFSIISRMFLFLSIENTRVISNNLYFIIQVWLE